MVDTPEQYRWSSDHANALGHGDAWLTPQPLYDALGRTSAERQARYRSLFSDKLGPDTLHEIRQSVNQGVVLGDETFRDQIEAALDVRARPGRRGRPRVKRE